jgi:acyl dehydratase
MEKLKISNDLVGVEFDPYDTKWSHKDAVLYALGVGAKPGTELDYLYEGKGPKVIPTFSSVTGGNALVDMLNQIDINLMMLLHGEQMTTVYRPIPPNASGKVVGKIVEVWDKGKAAVLSLEIKVVDSEGPIFANKSTVFIRGAGGFGGERGPSTKGKNEVPSREPDHVFEDITLPEQAALYRLNGDPNPIHIDPEFATMAGFEKPFLHGMCSYGFACRAVIQTVCKKEPEKFKSMEARFADQVYMGDKLITKLWELGGGEAIMQVENQDGKVILSQSKVTYEE